MSLRKQATSLAIMHAADVLQPLLVLPYAGRVLGPHEFGRYVYAISLGQIAATIVEYGFHWTAQRAASSARQEPAALASLFAEVVTTKTILCFVVTLAGFAVAGGVLGVSKPLFLCAMLTAFGGILFPAWLFIGLERAWQAAFAIVVARGAALAGFLALVTSSAHIELAVAIQSSIPLVSGIVSLPFVFPVGFGGFRSLRPSHVIMQFRNGWSGFLFAFVERASTTLPIPLVEHFGGAIAAGQFAVAEKFMGATRPFLRIMVETFLPRVAYYARHDRSAGLALIRRSMLTLAIGSGLSLGLFFVAPYIILILFGPSFSGAIPIVRVMAIIPLLMNVNVLTSNLYMFNYGHERAWTMLTVSGLLVFLVVAFLLSPHLMSAAIGVTVGIIAKEGVVAAVSSGFFVAFGMARLRSGAARHEARRPSLKVTAGYVLPSFVRAAWRSGTGRSAAER